MGKLKSQKLIIQLVKILKRKNKKIVTCNGSFDILHQGHFERLEEAKKQGDVLIVCLNSDKSIKAYKGPARPINKQSVRVKNLAALDYVDYLVIFNEINPKKILSKIKPHIHCVGRDWGKDCIEREVVEKNGGRIYVAKWVSGFSTSNLIKIPSVRAVFLDRDGTINVNEQEYVHAIEDFKFIPGVLPALKRLSKTGYKIFITTNQSGIGRGYYTEKDLKKLHQWLLDKFKKENIRIDKIYYCPHHPKENCNCRKPKIGMLEKAAKDFGIDLSKSWIIGDSKDDILMGKEANLKTILIGKNVKNLKEAVDLLLLSKNTMKKIAIIGFGRFGTVLFDKFNKYGDVKFVCEKEIDEKLLDFKQNFGVAVSDNYEKVLDKVDLVVVATPAETHYSIIKKCLQRGKDVFVEKPLANSVSEAKELIEAAEAKKLKLYIDNVFLYRKEFQELKKRIQERKIKKIIFRWRKYGTFNDSILNNLVYHDMYMLIDLLGSWDTDILKLVEVKDPLKRGRVDILEFRFNYNGTRVECKYDRTYNGKEKYMEIIIDNENLKWLNNKIIINNKTEEIKEQDALLRVVKDLLDDKVDYTQNHLLALKSLECLQQIKYKLNN